MGAKNTGIENANFFLMKAKTSDTDPKPFIGQSKKVGDVWEIAEKDRFNSIDGFLTAINLKTYEHKGETKNVCVMTLRDADGTTNQLQSNFNNLLYSLINSLSNCDPGFIDIQVYLGKAKVKDGKLGKQYPGGSLKNNGEDVKWRLQFSETPQPIYSDVMVGEGKKAKKVTVVDDTEVIDFWKEEIAQIGLRLKEKPAFVATAKKTDSAVERMVDSEDQGIENSIAAQTTMMEDEDRSSNESLVLAPDDDLPF